MALSTAAVLYFAPASAAQEAVWLQHLASDLNETSVEPTVIYDDNKSIICMTKNPHYHGRTEHVDIKFHLIGNKWQQEQYNYNTVQALLEPRHHWVPHSFGLVLY